MLLCAMGMSAKELSRLPAPVSYDWLGRALRLGSVAFRCAIRPLWTGFFARFESLGRSLAPTFRPFLRSRSVKKGLAPAEGGATDKGAAP